MAISEAYGAGSSINCPRSRNVWLRIKATGRILIIATTCRTYRCLGCRERNLRRIRLLIEFGCWTAERSWLITVTYRFDEAEALRKGLAVRRDQARLFSQWRAIHPSLKWFTIPELTKNGQVHLHLIVTGLDESRRSACEREPDYGRGWRERSCVCLEHELSRLWYGITGDSFVVDVRQILSSARAAAYTAKYVIKGMANRAALVRLGFHRRWSCSRNWPRAELLTRGGVTDAWEPVGASGSAEAEKRLLEKSEGHRLFDRVGSPEAMAFDKRIRDRGLKQRLELVIDNLRTTSLLAGFGFDQHGPRVRGGSDTARRGPPRDGPQSESARRRNRDREQPVLGH